MTSKPDGYVETYVLQELKDKTEMANHIWGLFRNIYGICYENVEVDERTGEIHDKYDGQY